MDKPQNPRRSDQHADELASGEVEEPSMQPMASAPDPFSDFSDFEISLLEGADLAGVGTPDDEDTEWFLSSLSASREAEPLGDIVAEEDTAQWHVPVDEDEVELPFERYMRSFGSGTDSDDLEVASEAADSGVAWDSSAYPVWERTPGAWSSDEDESIPSTIFNFEEPEPVMAEAFAVEEPEPVMAEAFAVEEPAGIGAEVNASEQSDAERRFLGTGGPADMPDADPSQRRTRLERAFQVLRRTALLASDSTSVRDQLFQIVDKSELGRAEAAVRHLGVDPETPPAGDGVDEATAEPASHIARAPHTITIGQARETSAEPILTSTSLAVDYRSTPPEVDEAASPSTFFTEMAAKNEVFSNTMEIDARKLESYTGQWQVAQEQAHRPEAKPEVAAPQAAAIVTAEPKRRWLRKKRD